MAVASTFACTATVSASWARMAVSARTRPGQEGGCCFGSPGAQRAAGVPCYLPPHRTPPPLPPSQTAAAHREPARPRGAPHRTAFWEETTRATIRARQTSPTPTSPPPPSLPAPGHVHRCSAASKRSPDWTGLVMQGVIKNYENDWISLAVKPHELLEPHVVFTLRNATFKTNQVTFLFFWKMKKNSQCFRFCVSPDIWVKCGSEMS